MSLDFVAACAICHWPLKNMMATRWNLSFPSYILMKHELGEGSFERGGKKKMEPKFLKLKVSTPPVSEKRSLLYLCLFPQNFTCVLRFVYMNI